VLLRIAVAATLMVAAGCASDQPEPPAPTPEPSTAGTVVVAAYGSGAGELVANTYAAALNGGGIPARVRVAPDSAGALTLLVRGRADLAGVPASDAAAYFTAAALRASASGPTPGGPTPSAAASGSPTPSATGLEPSVSLVTDAAAAAGLAVLATGEAADGGAFAVREVFAESNSVTSLSDLAEYSESDDVVLASGPGCRRRPFCLPVLESGYGIRVADLLRVPAGAVATAVEQRRATFGETRSTDAAVPVDRLRYLDDDLSLLPPANIVPLIVDASAPDVRAVVDRVQERLTTRDLQLMAQAVAAGASPAQAADAWVTTNLVE